MPMNGASQLCIIEYKLPAAKANITFCKKVFNKIRSVNLVDCFTFALCATCHICYNMVLKR